MFNRNIQKSLHWFIPLSKILHIKHKQVPLQLTFWTDTRICHHGRTNFHKTTSPYRVWCGFGNQLWRLAVCKWCVMIMLRSFDSENVVFEVWLFRNMMGVFEKIACAILAVDIFLLTFCIADIPFEFFLL